MRRIGLISIAVALAVTLVSVAVAAPAQGPRAGKKAPRVGIGPATALGPAKVPGESMVGRTVAAIMEIIRSGDLRPEIAAAIAELKNLPKQVVPRGTRMELPLTNGVAH